jgi:hypothetical protein
LEPYLGPAAGRTLSFALDKAINCSVGTVVKAGVAFWSVLAKWPSPHKAPEMARQVK